MSQPLAHLYALALRALDEHDRRADALRGRLGPVLAAAALAASLLSGPVVGGTHPTSIVGKLALVVAVGGLLTTILRLAEARDRHLAAYEHLAATFTAMLWGILVMLCGLALAAIVG